MHATNASTPQITSGLVEIRWAARTPRRDHTRRRGFSLTELLVVIGIIVLLVSILLVAMKQVQNTTPATKTRTTMTNFANSCTAFQTAIGYYPRVIPEEVLAAIALPPITSTENALLAMMGGCRVLSPADDNLDGQVEADYVAYFNTPDGVNLFEFNIGTWKLKVDKTRIGEGPYINGKSYAPFYAGTDIGIAVGQIGDVVNADGSVTPGLPDLLDAWGQPIIYTAQSRGRGPLRPDPASPAIPCQFLLAGVSPYLDSTALGEMGINQTTTSVFNTASNAEADRIFAQIIRSSSLANAGTTEPILNSPARGAFVLISAGPDGIFFSTIDGVASAQDPFDGTGDITISDLLDDQSNKVYDEFNDIVIFGGA